MKRTLEKAAFAVLLAFLSGCGGGSSSSSQQSAPVNLAGNWQFTAKSTPFGITVVGNGSIQQNGSSISGQLSLSGTPCATTASLSGTITGTSLNFQIQEGSQPVSFTGTAAANGSSASGTYTAPSGGCTNGDFGTWTGTRVSPLAGMFTGSLRSNATVNVPFQIAASFTQGGDGNLTGTATITNSICFTSVSLLGRVRGESLTIMATDPNNPEQMIRFSGTIDPAAQSASVTYSVAGGHCAGESGSGILSRQGPGAQ